MTPFFTRLSCYLVHGNFGASGTSDLKSHIESYRLFLMTYSDPWHMFVIYWPVPWSYGSMTSILQCNANLYCIFSWGTEKLNILFKIMKPGSHKTVTIFNSDPSDSKAHDPNHFNTLKLWHGIPAFFMLLCNCLCIFSVVPHFSLSIFPTIVQGS